MNSLLAKARTFWSCLIGRLNSLKSGDVVQVVVVYGVVLIYGVYLVGVDEEQAGPPETGSEVEQVVVDYGVFLVHQGDEEQARLAEKARTLGLECIMNSLLAKARTFWSCLIGRLNSLKSGEVVQVALVDEAVGLVGIKEEQAILPEKARTLRLEWIMKSLLAKAQTFWSCLIGRKVNSLKSGNVVQVVIVYEVVLVQGVDLIGVGEEKAGPPETGSEAVQVVIVCGFVLARVDREQAKLQRNKRDGLISRKTLKSLMDSRRQLLYSKECLILLNEQLKDGLNLVKLISISARLQQQNLTKGDIMILL